MLDLTDAEKGWVAGIIDGEGCIRLDRMRRKQGNTIVLNDSLKISVNSVDPRMLLKLRELVGGTIAPCHSRRRPMWCWQISTRLVRELLPLVMPYLVVKREQAEVALEFTSVPPRERARGKRLDLVEDARREGIVLRLAALKRKDWAV